MPIFIVFSLYPLIFTFDQFLLNDLRCGKESDADEEQVALPFVEEILCPFEHFFFSERVLEQKIHLGALTIDTAYHFRPSVSPSHPHDPTLHTRQSVAAEDIRKCDVRHETSE